MSEDDPQPCTQPATPMQNPVAYTRSSLAQATLAGVLIGINATSLIASLAYSKPFFVVTSVVGLAGGAVFVTAVFKGK